MRQLPLPFFTPVAFRAEEFIPDASNQAALRWLAEPARWPNGRLVLAGPAGTGKSHLLAIAAQRFGWAALDGPALRGLPEAPGRGVALDDADLIGEEAALFHLINACAEARLPLLMAARRPPPQWRLALPDLRSRLAAAGLAMLEEPSEALLDALWGKQLAERQLAVDSALLAPLRHRLPRDAATVAEAAARLDRASLAAGRLTRAVALAALAPLLADDDASVIEAAPPMPDAPRLL